MARGARSSNAKYLGTLWTSLDEHRAVAAARRPPARWRAAKPDDAAALGRRDRRLAEGAVEVRHASDTSARSAGRRRWMEPVNPLVASQELRFKVPAAPDGKDVTLSLVAADAGDGNEHDFVVWQRPRLVAPGRPDLLLRDVRRVTRDLATRRERVFAEHGEVPGRGRRGGRGAGAGRRRPTGPEARRRAGRSAGLARLPRHRHRRRGAICAVTSPTRSVEGRRLRLHQRLGHPTRRRSCWPTRPISTSAFPAT